MARVAIVDDEIQVRRMLRKLFEGMGHSVVVEAGSVDETLQKLHESDVDLLITDIAMPGTDGLSMIRDVRAMFPDTRIIAMTGFSPGCLAVATQLGADRVIRKPFGMREMRRLVVEVASTATGGTERVE
jgi:two-component system response regulator HydG